MSSTRLCPTLPQEPGRGYGKGLGKTGDQAMSENALFIGKGEAPQALTLKYANRQGLISGAAGAGRTVTPQRLAEGCLKAGVPAFAADAR